MTGKAVLIAVASIFLAMSAEASDLEDIYILRSIREPQASTTDGCAASRTGFEPFPADAELFFSFWSVRLEPEDGKVVDARQKRVAELRGCFGPTNEPARQNFYAEVRRGAISFHGRGECQALKIDFPETGLFPGRCHLILSGLPAPFAGAAMIGGLAASTASAQDSGRNSGPLGARLRGVQHFGLTVQNMDRAFEFYTEVLGGTEVMRDDDFQGERIHNTLLTDQEIEARVLPCFSCSRGGMG
jgi:hypothetical protein